jgi:hypothetical protein
MERSGHLEITWRLLVKVGDMVRYKQSEFLSDHIHKKFFGIIIEVSSLRYKDDKNVRVKWNTAYSSILWHEQRTLEVISESG